MSHPESMTAAARRFIETHPVCDMLGLNLTHPRFVIDHIDLGRRDDTTCRGDFVKFAEWGIRLLMCKGGPVVYDSNFAGLWPQQPEWRPGRDDTEPLYLSPAFKNPTQVVMALLDRFLGDVEANDDKVRLIRTVADLDSCLAGGPVGLLMGSNRADWFGDVPGVLRMFARLGLRMITLSSSGRDPGWDGHDVSRGSGGLTELGVRMIDEMNRCGILIDLAHSNDVCALDVIEVSAAPVVDTHSSPRALEPSTRNTSDEVMLALSESGGLLGLMPAISRPEGERPYEGLDDVEVDSVRRTLDYAIDLMGIDHVGIGTHFNTACMPWLIDRLLADGMADEEVARLFGGNYLRVLRDVLPT